VTLLVDCGNSRIKWAVSAPAWRTGAFVHRAADMLALLDEHWSALPRPARVVLSCVTDGARRAALAGWIERRWARSAEFIEARAAACGVRNGYREPTRLGPDRWAALIGARAMTTEPVCVVDCGTAVTADAMNGAGEFLGGVIFPGLTLLGAGLAGGTAAVGPGDGVASSCQARSTADAAAAGVLYGCAGAIARFIEEHKKILGARMQVLVCGGDATALMPLLPVGTTAAPDLVLYGLQRIANAP
jgi:type III pantothenate kinase